MAALPEDFLKKVIAETCALKGLVDANKQVKESDPTITACTKIAYSQVCSNSGCKRAFHYGQRTTYFDTYTGPLLLRTIPIDRTKPIEVFVDGVALAPEDFSFQRGRLVLGGITANDPRVTRFTNIELFAYSGIPLLEMNTTLFTAVQMQTVGNYHRRDTLGLRDVVSGSSGQANVSRSPADAGDLLDSVITLLQDQVYEGIGYSMEGE